MAFMEDPRVARQFARATWIVLVAAFVLLTRFPLSSVYERAALGALITLVCLLNLPVALGLFHTRAASGTGPYRAVALAFGMRVIASAAVVAIIAR